MKRIIAATLIATATLAGAASAMTNNTVAIHDIQHFVPGADLSQLTEQDINILLTFAHGGDSFGETASKIRAHLQ